MRGRCARWGAAENLRVGRFGQPGLEAMAGGHGPGVGDGEGVARDATTLAEVVDAYASAGFVGSFRAVRDGRITCLACRSMLDAATLRPVSMRRLEGASDPADMLAIVALVCPVCAARGTLVLGYGPDATAEDSDVLPALLSAPPPSI
jgi:hypothetical protein